jgi:alkaline phosphatase D
MTEPLGRRAFLALAAAAAAGGCASRRPGLLPGPPFTLGVASGDPSPDGFVLWTRLAPEGGGMGAHAVEVDWDLSADEAFSKIVRSGRAVAASDFAHAVHVEVDGLEPARPYWYRFRAGGHESPVGRALTAPRPEDAPRRLRVAVASCQHLEHGLFTAYEHMLKEDVDLVLHLGDYIYEGAGVPKKIRRHVGPECITLEDYRTRYAQYKADPALQAMHAAAPWLVTPDDHEFDNNCAGDVSEEKNVKPADFLRRRAAAFQAYYEHMPLRRTSVPKGPDMRLYRRVPWGRLAEFFVLDTRQYRTDQPCGDGNKPPCGEERNPEATLMGAAQRDWLFSGLARTPATWSVVAQQVMVARVDRKAGPDVAYSMDQWPGYEAERRRLLEHLEAAKVRNPVLLAGDIHTNWANDLTAGFDGAPERKVGAEFVGTSISSGGDGVAEPKDLDRLYAENPFVKFHNAERGYLLCEADAGAWKTRFRTVPFVLKPGAPLQTRATFVVEPGRPGVRRA